MNLYTYYEPMAGGNPSRERALLELWADDWKRAGWEPRALGESNRLGHPLTDELLTRVSTYPTVNGRAYEDACYLRWLALDTVGGGWFCDYDVFSATPPFNPPDPKGAQTFNLDHRRRPGFVYMTREGIARVLKRIMSHVPSPHHNSDMTILCAADNASIWDRVESHVMDFGEPGWEKGPLIHFHNGAMWNNRALVVDRVLKSL